MECYRDSSDSEYHEEDRRRNKVNLRQLEERLNMIQEECNRLSEESDDELSATIDDKSELHCEADLLDEAETLNCDSHQVGEESGPGFESVFNKIDQFLENGRGTGRGAGRSRSEGKIGGVNYSCHQP